MIAAGIKPRDYAVSATRDYVPAGVDLIEERVKEFDPDGNKIVTESGKPVPYDFLIVATGLKLDYDSIPGMASPLTEIDPPYAQESDPPVATERRAVLTV